MRRIRKRYSFWESSKCNHVAGNFQENIHFKLSFHLIIGEMPIALLIDCSVFYRDRDYIRSGRQSWSMAVSKDDYGHDNLMTNAARHGNPIRAIRCDPKSEPSSPGNPSSCPLTEKRDWQICIKISGSILPEFPRLLQVTLTSHKKGSSSHCDTTKF